MSGHQTATIGDTVYFWFAANDTSGSGGDGATPLFDVREAGAAAGAIPLLSGTPTLLSHADYPAGSYEIAVAATGGNGFAADDTFAVFCTLAIDSQNPSGFVGSCTLTPLAKAGVAVVLPSIPANWITAAGINAAAFTEPKFGADFLTSAKIADNAFLAVNFAASSLDGKGNWNIGKTGYSLTQSFPTNFADMAITVTTGLVSVGTLPSIPANWITAAGINAAALNGKGDWNIGKSGYSLTVADWNVGKTGYSLSQAFPTNFADLAIVVTTGLVSVGTLPSIPANWITAAGINAAAITAAKFGTGALDAAALNADAAAKIRDAILPTQNAVFNNLEFLFVAASDHVTPVTGATGTGVTRSIDGGAFGAGTGTLAEVGNGIYQYDASAADMNGGVITFRFTGTGGTPGAPDDRFVTIVTGGGV